MPPDTETTYPETTGFSKFRNALTADCTALTNFNNNNRPKKTHTHTHTQKRRKEKLRIRDLPLPVMKRRSKEQKWVAASGIFAWIFRRGKSEHRREESKRAQEKLARRLGWWALLQRAPEIPNQVLNDSSRKLDAQTASNFFWGSDLGCHHPTIK